MHHRVHRLTRRQSLKLLAAAMAASLLPAFPGFAAGGGRIGNYDSCAWQVLGQGQFRALDGSQPFIGQVGQVEVVEEWKVELVVADELIVAVVAALKLSHPYETPAYEVWRLADF